MNELIHIDRKELFLEIARYLPAVDLYRAENLEATGSGAAAGVVQAICLR